MNPCAHEEFEAVVSVGRLTGEAGNVNSYMADIRVKCRQCDKPFQFLGLEAGLNLAGAAVSVDGLEARIALCPLGEQPSALDRIAAHFPTERKH